MTDDRSSAADFPPASREDWLKLVRAALKDRPFERLVSKTADGIPIEPLYGRAADAHPVASRRGPWAVQARVDHPDPAIANAEALHELQNGATGLTLVFSGSAGAYGYGLPGDAKSIARALEGVHLDAIAIELQTAEPTREAADHVAALVKGRGHAPGAVNIRFGHDALGAHSLTGTLPIPYSELMPRFAEHVGSLAQAGFKSPLTAADGRIVHNAGGSEAQELAFVIAVAVAYLRALEAAGTPLDAARAMIEFRLTADADQFLTVAKFRALRLLWARVEQSCGLTAEARLHLRRDGVADDDPARSVGEHAARNHRRVLRRHWRNRRDRGTAVHLSRRPAGPLRPADCAQHTASPAGGGQHRQGRRPGGRLRRH